MSDKRQFSLGTHARQTWAIAGASFGMIAKSVVGLPLLAAIAVLMVIVLPLIIPAMGVSIIPRTEHVIALLAAPVANSAAPVRAFIPLLIVFYAGELIWRERDNRLGEITDTTPVPTWVFLTGKFVGLALVLAAWLALLMTAGVLTQARMGYFDFEIGVYLRILFGMQLVDYLLFGLLVFAVHTVVNQKQVGYLVSIIAYGVIAFASTLGIEHKLLVYASDLGWTYTDMRGLGASLRPWLWFKLYWAAWALLLAVVARLLYVRGRESGMRSRLRLARQRLTRSVAAMGATAVALILLAGGYIYYNTNVLHAYETAANRTKRSAEYERRYRRYFGIAQPRLTGTTLRVELYPERRSADIHGSYRLVNDREPAIQSVHVSLGRHADTKALSFDRPFTRTVDDMILGYKVYALKAPLQPGDTVRMTFDVHFESHGFNNNGADADILANGTHFTNVDWLPAIGYQASRELQTPGARRQAGLAQRRVAASFDDTVARRIRVGGDMIDFEAVLGTSASQIAVAPGALRRTWQEAGRRYFHYVTDAPVNNEYGVFSANYALHEEQWRPSSGSGPGVAIQIFHDPRHDENVAGMVRAVRASLEYHTQRFSPYTHSYVKLIENPSVTGVHSEAATVEYGEAFSSLTPGNAHEGRDQVFAVVAHAVAREWWGMQVGAADVEGAGLLSQGLETYSSMRVVEEVFGGARLRRDVDFMRATPRPRAAPPLLRATSSFAFTRQGPLALYAIREYIGRERVDDALRQFNKTHGPRNRQPATSMDFYRELQTVTPDSLRYLLHDLFEKNTFWQLETNQVLAHETKAGDWQVTLEITARKVVVDEAGVETEVPMDEWMEVGAFSGGEAYVQKHRVRSGQQTITFTVPKTPDRAGIDPRHLLSEVGEEDHNVKVVKTGN